MSSISRGIVIRYTSTSKKLEDKVQLKDNFMSTININELEKIVNSELASKIQKSVIANDELLIETSVDELINTIQFLKSKDKCRFRQLIDIAGVDYPNEERDLNLFIYFYLENNLRIKVSINFEADKKIPSVTKIFSSANWMEEVFDMYGIKFINHPDLRRILTDYNFKGHPLRKDFPLTGFTEVRYSEKIKK